jgi:hypothetical protein
LDRLPLLAALAGCLVGGCGRGWSSWQVIFLGKVTADTETEAPVAEDSGAEGSEVFLQGSMKTPPMNHAVHFSITESFRGEGQPWMSAARVTGIAAIPSSWASGTWCMPRLWVSPSRRAPARSQARRSQVGGDLRELRAIRDGYAVDSLFGTVSLLSSRAEPWLLSLTKLWPLADVSVRVTDSAGRVSSTKTDERGVYAFEWLPPDSYRIEQDLPAGLQALSDVADKPFAVDLTDNDAKLIGCRADIRARPEGQMPGTVVDSQGRSVAGIAGNKRMDPKKQILAPSADETSSRSSALRRTEKSLID